MSSFLLFIGSLGVVGLGRPSLFPLLGVFSFIAGFALFFRSIEGASKKRAIILSFVWFSLVQLIQLFWFVSHPYSYIYPVWFFFSLLWGAQFAWLASHVPLNGEIGWSRRFAIAGFWVLLEWGRLFFMSGFTWNPLGLAPTGIIPFLHWTSLFGVFGLTYVGMLLNMTLLSEWRRGRFIAAPLIVAILVGGGSLHYMIRAKESDQDSRQIKVALLQTAFPVEETLFQSLQEMFLYVEQEWAAIFDTLARDVTSKVDLIVLPELTVPYGTYMPIFSLEEMEHRVISLLGEEGKASMPELVWPYAFEEKGVWKVTNAFLAQTLSNYFSADLIVGFEDAERLDNGEVEHYNAALLFSPYHKEPIGRYEKRVLVPMGEYIPFSFCRELCKSYGVTGSYTPGKGAKALEGYCRYGLSICYEETYGALMSESKEARADLLCNLTSDVWYPNSLLPQEHFAHARPRSVEMGLPLVRACNTGVTGAVDSLGRVIAELPGEWTRSALLVDVPLYSYFTFYSLWGDTPVLIISLLSLLGFARKLLNRIESFLLNKLYK